MSKLRSSIKKYLLEERKRGTLIGRIGGSWIDRRREQRYERFAALPVDRDLIVFECFKGNKYTDSPKAIYEYLLGHEEYKRFRFVWCFRGGSPDSAAGSTAGTASSPLEEFAYLADDVRTEIVRWGSEEYYRTYAAAAYWITNARLPKAISKKPGQIYVQCWHGTPLKKLGCDITTEATESAEVTREVIHGDASRYDYLISPSRFCSEKLSSAFDLRALGKENIILEVGYPRNDSLALFAAEESQIPEETSEMITTGIKTLSYHEQAEALRQSLGIPPGNKTILYAPT